MHWQRNSLGISVQVLGDEHPNQGCPVWREVCSYDGSACANTSAAFTSAYTTANTAANPNPNTLTTTSPFAHGILRSRR